MNTWCGSPPYAAPELFQGKEYAGPEVDVWSLGVVLYVLVCGSLPFDGSTLPKLRARVIAGKFKVPFYMSPDCERLVKRMLTLDPLKRATLQQVTEDKWYNEGFENEENTIIPGITLTNVQQQVILEEIETIGMDPERAAQSVKEGSYDSHAATFYLLADRRFRQKAVNGSTAKPTTTEPATSHKKAATAQPPKKASTTLDNENEEKESSVQSAVKKDAPGPSKVPVRARRATVAANTSSDKVTNEGSFNKSKEALLPPPRGLPTPSGQPGRPTSSAKKTPSPTALLQSATVPPAQLPTLPPITRRSSMGPISYADAKKQVQSEWGRFTVSLTTTTLRDPGEVHSELMKILDGEGIKHTTTPIINCKVETLEFELEVVKVPNLAVYCLRFKRLSGNAWEYKDALTQLISKLNLQE